MAANTNPIFGRTPDIQFSGAVLGTTAVTALDGSGNLSQIFRADTVEGGYVNRIQIKGMGTTAATVVRIFLCSSSDTTFTPGTSNTTANTALFTELALPATTPTNTGSNPDFVIPLNLPIPPGFRILVGFGTSTGAAGNGFVFTTIASKY